MEPSFRGQEIVLPEQHDRAIEDRLEVIAVRDREPPEHFAGPFEIAALLKQKTAVIKRRGIVRIDREGAHPSEERFVALPHEAQGGADRVIEIGIGGIVPHRLAQVRWPCDNRRIRPPGCPAGAAPRCVFGSTARMPR